MICWGAWPHSYGIYLERNRPDGTSRLCYCLVFDQRDPVNTLALCERFYRAFALARYVER